MNEKRAAGHNLSEALILYNKLLSSKYVCIFPMGQVGINVYNSLIEIGINVDYFIDNKTEKHGEMLGDSVCISLDSFKDIATDAFIVIAAGSYDELNEIAVNAGASDTCAISHIKMLHIKQFTVEYLTEYKAKLNELKPMFSDNFSINIIGKLYDVVHNYNYLKSGYKGIVTYPQYFDRNIFNFSSDEIFVDAGAFTGDTIQEFVDCVHSNFNKIYAFEIDTDILRKLESNVAKLNTTGTIEIINAGLSDKNGASYVSKGVVNNSRLSDEGEEVRLLSLDSVLGDSPVSFIKMDIEGSELVALHGAKNTIIKYRPKLAICVYHHPNDLYDISHYIKHLIPDYKLYLRHHTNIEYETVLYATI